MRSYLAKHGVDVIEMWLPGVGDEELTLVRVGALARH